MVWKIAGGIVLGFLILGMLDAIRQRLAVEAWLTEVKRIQADPDPLGWRRAAAAKQRGALLKPPYECVSGTVVERGRDAGGVPFAKQLIIAYKPMKCSGQYMLPADQQG